MTNRTTGIGFAALFIALAVMMTGTAGAQEETPPSGWDYYYRRALRERYQGDYAGAIADMSKVISLRPGKPEFYNARGIIYEKLGDYDSAMADYEQALSINPGSAEAVHNIGNLNARLGQAVNLTDWNTMPQNTAAAGIPPQPVQNDTYSQPDAVPQVSGQSVYGDGGQAPQSAQSAQSAQYDPYSRPGIVAFFQEQPYSPPAAPIPKQDSRSSGGPAPVVAPVAAPVAAPPVTGDYGQTVVIYRSGTAQPVLNLPSDRRLAGPGTVTALAGGSAADGQGRLQEDSFPRRQPLRSGAGGAARDGKAQAPVVPAQKVFVDPVAEIYNKYGAALYGHGLYDAAILQFNEAVKTYPNYAIAYNNRGLAFAAKGDMANAAADFDQALRINPYYYDAQFNRSLLLNAVASLR